MKVKNLLKLIENEENCVVVLYAYGQYYADTYKDGMRTVEDIKERLCYDGMEAKVFRIYSHDKITDDGLVQFNIVINAEMIWKK